MTQDVLWMTETYFKDNSVVNDNTDWKIIQPIMIMVQDQYIHPLLGTDLFDEIADQIYGNTVSSANQTLLNLYIRKCIIYYTLSELAPVIKYRFHNKGIMVRSGENSQPASIEEVQSQIEYWKNKAEWQAQRITGYLIENNTTYPLFYNGNTTSDTLKPKKNNFTSNIFFDDDEDSCRANIFK